MPQKQYYDDQGNPIGTPSKTYYDDAGQPLKASGQRGQPPSSSNREAGPTSMTLPVTGETLKRVGTNMAIGAVGLMGGEALAPILAPILSKVPGLAGVTKNILSGPLSSISMATLENLLKGNINPTDIGEDALINEGVSKAISPLIKAPGAIKRGYEEFKKPGTYTDKLLNRLGATFAQHTGSPTANFIENTLATGTKNKAVKTSENLAKDIIESDLTNLALNPVSPDDYLKLAGSARTKEAANYYNSARASTARGNLVQGMAAQPANEVPIYKQVTTVKPASLIQIAGQPPNQPTLVTQTVLSRTVHGPTELVNSITHAKGIVDEIVQSPTRDALVNIIADPKYNKLQQTAARILAETNATFDNTGSLISHEPVSFKNAWQWQKDIGNYTAHAYETGVANFNKNQLNKLYGSIADDISASLPKWAVGGQQTLQVWNEAKALVKERQSNFFPSTGEAIGKFVLNKNINTRDAWNNIIADNHTLGKVLANPKMPVAVKAGIPIENPKREIATFKLADLWNNAKAGDNQGNEVFNTTKFFKDFNEASFTQSEDPLLPASRDILFSKGTQDDIRRFATALGGITPANPSRYIQLRIGTTGALALTSGIATALAGNSIPISAGVGAAVVGVSLSGHALARAMINKNTARIFVAMAEGQPLGIPEKFAARMIGNALKGEAANLIHADGNETPGIMGPNGTFKTEVNK